MSRGEEQDDVGVQDKRRIPSKALKISLSTAEERTYLPDFNVSITEFG